MPMDPLVALKRYGYLGREFLTWLWYVTENDPGQVEAAAGDSVVVVVGNRIALERVRGESVERVTIRGEAAQMEEGLVALRKGALVAEVNLSVEIGDQAYSLNLRGEDLAASSIRTPATERVRVVDELAGAVFEKAGLLEKLFSVVDNLFLHFVRLRISDSWSREVLAMRKWIASYGAVQEASRGN
ncbi:MAG: hypothetical protein JRI97_06295 [Deltaproteobacteria bacterium]|nr:hypothetical protein [Deltaproteobacteria bacterium]